MEHKISPGTGHSARRWTRITASAAAATLLLTLVPSASATNGDGVTPTCDEAYYATTDYYGNLSKGSVVKSYAMNGKNKVTDYGTYKKVNNLTDDTKAETSGDKTTFNFGKDVPDHFYFEGETSQPFDDLPWKISLTYKLNGVPVKANKLKGKSGMVEIDLDMVPNKNASEYARNNYTLETMTAFNQNDILSLKAEGAQVQLVGNLRMVLFVALPGEEQHVSIQVGTDDFQFDGMTYLMVPATLSQLKQISELKDKKAKLEDNYKKLNTSFDQMLSSLNSMSSSLNEAASGLDEMSSAMGSMTAGAGSAYGAADLLQADLGQMVSALTPMADQMEADSKMLAETQKSAQTLVDATVSLKTVLASVRTDLTKLQKDGKGVKQLVSDTAALKDSLNDLQNALNGLSGVSGISMDTSTASDTMKDVVKLGTVYTAAVNCIGTNIINPDAEKAFYTAVLKAAGVPTTVLPSAVAACASHDTSTMSATETAINKAAGTTAIPTGTLAELYTYYQLYQASVAANARKVPSFQQYATTLLTAQAGSSTLTSDQQTAVADKASAMAESWNLYNTMNSATNSLSGSISSANAMITSLKTPAANLIGKLSALCSELGGLNAALDDADSAAETAKIAATQGDAILDALNGLSKTVNSYVPTAQKSLKSIGAMSKTAGKSLQDTASLLSALENLAKTNGARMSNAAQKSLRGMSSSLRKAAKSLGVTSSIRSAKDNMNNIVTDTWEEYTGKVNNLLNMDASAPAESLTSDENAAPQSVQVLIRTHEIKTSEKDTSSDKEKTADKGTFWSRLAGIFTGIWKDITGKSDD
jgi:putative membrane protein